MVAAARAAGASEATVAALAEDAQIAKREAAEGRPLGARLDSARARVSRCAAKLATAEEAVAVAKSQHEAAEKELAESRAAMAELEAEVAQAPAPADGVEAGKATPNTLEEALAEVARLHVALASLRGESTLDEVADAEFGDAELDDSGSDSGSSPARDEHNATPAPARQAATDLQRSSASRIGSELDEVRDGRRTPPRARAATGKGASGSSRGK